MTIREALAEGNCSLAAAGIENPGLDTSLFLAEVLGISRSSLISGLPEPLGDSAFAAYRRLIERRRNGECTAYIIGRKEFYGLDILVNPSVLAPRPETEILVEEAVRQAGIITESLHVLDLCTGSGAIALAIKHQIPTAQVWATDISADALETARQNSARLLAPDSIHFCQGDLFTPLSGIHTPFSIIVSNPPYIPSAKIASLSREVRGEPVLALDGGADGLDVIRNIISGAPDFLDSNGALLLEADPDQMDEIAFLYKKSGFSCIKIIKDLSGHERVISGKLTPVG